MKPTERKKKTKVVGLPINECPSNYAMICPSIIDFGVSIQSGLKSYAVVKTAYNYGDIPVAAFHHYHQLTWPAQVVGR